MGDGKGKGGAIRPSTSFSPVTSKIVGTTPETFWLLSDFFWLSDF